MIKCNNNNVISVVVLPSDARNNKNLVSDEEEQLDKKVLKLHMSLLTGLLFIEEEVKDDTEETIYQCNDR